MSITNKVKIGMEYEKFYSEIEKCVICKNRKAIRNKECRRCRYGYKK